MDKAGSAPHNTTCPVCKGRGHVPSPRKHTRDRTAERNAMAKTLRRAGYSIRQIQELLGWKSPRSAHMATRGVETSNG